MGSIHRILPVALLGLGLSACDRSEYLSPAVVLETEKGHVSCQLYTTDRLYWDEATGYPETMTKSEADAYCKAAGRERKDAAEAQAATQA
ncbi:MAG: hypothetical protein MK042_00395 [Cognatishimia sp.]|nr:hypothetical protein [Cognatishimia sp.]